MKRLQTTVEMSRTFDLGGGYNSLKLTIREVAEYDAEEDEQEVKSILRAGIRKQFREEAKLYPDLFKGQTQVMIAGVPVALTQAEIKQLQDEFMNREEHA